MDKITLEVQICYICNKCVDTNEDSELYKPYVYSESRSGKKIYVHKKCLYPNKNKDGLVK